MESHLEFEVPTWSQLYESLLAIAQRIRSSGYRVDLVVGVARGGVVAARILTDLLEAPQLGFVHVSFYVDLAQTAPKPTLRCPAELDVEDRNVLLVDDIADSGRSLQLAKSHLQSQGPDAIRTATIYYKPTSCIIPDYYDKQAQKWVVFPWEAKETLRKIAEKQPGRRALHAEVAKLVKAGLPKQLTQKLLTEIEQEHHDAPPP